MLHHIDEASKCTILYKLKLHTGEELQRAEQIIIGHHEHYNRHLKQITFDRESAIIAICDWLLGTTKIRLRLKAANQHAAKIEIENRLLKQTSAAIKAGAMDRFGYKPPASWSECIVYHTTSCRNAMVRPGLTDRPIVLFTGIPFGSLR
jgi:hypothetical protein